MSILEGEKEEEIYLMGRREKLLYFFHSKKGSRLLVQKRRGRRENCRLNQKTPSRLAQNRARTLRSNPANISSL